MAEGSGARMKRVTSRQNEEIALLRNRKIELVAEEQETSVNNRPVIYTADTSLRSLRKEQFESSVISLGLFNRCSWNTFKDVTREKDTLKIDVLITFLADIGKEPKDWPEISKLVVNHPKAVKRRYDQSCCFVPSKEVLIRSALALDTIFITCFFMEFFSVELEMKFFPATIHLKETFNRLSRERLKAELYADIFNMENQIPLVLIRNVVTIIIEERGDMDVNRRKVRDELFQAICSEARLGHLNSFPSIQFVKLDLKFDEHHHLLHSVAEAFRDGANAYTSKTNQIQRRSRMPRNGRKSRNGDNIRFYTHMPTAEELHKRGVTFEGQDDFLPHFKQRKFIWWKATLFLPRIECIADDTEKCWRNLLAWEDKYQTKEEALEQEKAFTQYLRFMDKLIDTERDVSLLLNGNNPVILEAGLGDNKAVADLFNCIMKNINLTWDDKWDCIVQEINAFHNNTYGRTIARIVRTYFGSQLLAVSVISAIILLVATLLQTVYTVK